MCLGQWIRYIMVHPVRSLVAFRSIVVFCTPRRPKRELMAGGKNFGLGLLCFGYAKMKLLGHWRVLTKSGAINSTSLNPMISIFARRLSGSRGLAWLESGTLRTKIPCITHGSHMGQSTNRAVANITFYYTVAVILFCQMPDYVLYN